MSTPSSFHPEVEALVAEIARDPRSCLLRIDRPQRPIRLDEIGEALSSQTPGLGLAERELLDLHRVEFSRLLRQRWVAEVEVRPAAGLFIARGSGVDDSAFEPGVDHPAVLAQDPQVGQQDPALLELTQAPRPLTSEELTRLVTTATRIHPTTTSRLFLANDLIRTQQKRSAVQLFRKILEFEPREELRSYCWDGIANAMGDSVSGIWKWYRRACETPNPRVDPLCIWLLMATQEGNLTMAREAAAQLDDLLSPTDPRLELHCQNQLRTRAEGRWSPRPTTHKLLDDLLGVVGPTSQRILHVLR